MKKIFYLLFLMIGLFLFIGTASAKVLTVEEIGTQIPKTHTAIAFSKLGENITAKVDSTNKTLDFYTDEGKAYSLPYKEGYIEFADRDTVITAENCDSQMDIALYLQLVTEAIIQLSGYEDKTLKEDAVLDKAYETHGLQVEVEEYSFTGVDADSGNWTKTGTYMRYYKISFDTDKIDLLVKDYGETIQNGTGDKTYPDLVPTLRADKITHNSVYLYPEVTKPEGETDTLYCYIYRSTSENGTYEKISDFAPSCEGGVGIKDEDLKPNTTYYYKAMVVGGEKYSNIVTVTTKENNTNNEEDTGDTGNNENETGEDNPNTGSFVSGIGLGILTIIGTVSIIYVSRKKSFINL